MLRAIEEIALSYIHDVTSSVTHLTIIAGGTGTRLAGVLGDLPKVLVAVGGKPLLQHQLELAARIRDQQMSRSLPGISAKESLALSATARDLVRPCSSWWRKSH